MKKCKAPNCENEHYTIGYCRKHYTQNYRHGHTLDVTRCDRRPATIEGNVAKLPLGINAKDGYAIVDKKHSYLDKYNWHLNQYGYVVRSGYINGKKTIIQLHREIMLFPDKSIDHVSGDKLDNRKHNLREATVSQNGYNRGAMSNNKSGYKGVSWQKKAKRFRAAICVNTVRMHIGQYKTAIEAAKAYDRAALKLHGEFARINNV